MSVIQFPGGKELNGDNKNIRYVKTKSDSPSLIVGPINFTCPHCTTKVTFDGQNLIFRSLEFYCGGCGSFHRVVNPAFFREVTTKQSPDKFDKKI